MSENKRLNNYDELPLVLDVADIQRIMGCLLYTSHNSFPSQCDPARRAFLCYRNITE